MRSIAGAAYDYHALRYNPGFEAAYWRRQWAHWHGELLEARQRAAPRANIVALMDILGASAEDVDRVLWEQGL